MSFPHPLTPSPCVLHISYLQRSEPIPLPLLVLSPVIISICPTELPIAVVETISKFAFVFATCLESKLSLSMEFPVQKLSLVGESVFDDQGPFSIVDLVSKTAIVRAFFTVEVPFNSFPFVVGAVKTDPILPLLAHALQHPRYEISVQNLVLCDDDPFPVGKVVFIESKEIKTPRVVLSVTLPLSILEPTLVEGPVGHRYKFTVGDRIFVLNSQSSNSLTHLGILQLLHEILTIDSVIFHFLRANITIPHRNNK